jgi:tRNA pseudouridine38-40 synthase
VSNPEKAGVKDDAHDDDDAIKGAPHGVLLSIAYEGADFSGWAAQDGRRTVADTIDGAIRTIDPKASRARGTSRTDAGVHADGQRAAFDAHLDIPPRGWLLALNQHLPDDVAVREVTLVPPGYQPRFSSRGKTYRYRLLLDRVRDPAFRRRAWRIGWPLDLDLAAREAEALVGTHDFATFRSAHDARVETVRTLTEVRIERESQRIAAIVVSGNAFMYNMVRILVGTLVDVARGHLPVGTLKKALDGKDRKLAGMTAPAHGLTLETIDLALPAEVGPTWPCKIS